MGNVFSENKSLIIENNNLKKCNQQLDDDIINQFEEEKIQNNCIVCQYLK